MACKIIVEPEAELDLEEAVNYYNDQQSGLGREFIERVDDVFDRIREMPEVHAVVHRAARLALVRRFPYVVCYIFEGDFVYVMAVFHGHRDPSSWQDRLK